MSEIRRALGPYRDALVTERASVALDPKSVQIVYKTASGIDATCDVELFEDLDIRDGEFENWIRNQRQAVDPTAVGNRVPIARPVVLIDVMAGVSDYSRWLTREISDRVTVALHDFADVTVIDGTRGPDTAELRSGPIGVAILLDARHGGDHISVSARLEHLYQGAIYNVARGRVPTEGAELADDAAVLQFVTEVVSKTLDAITSQAEETGAQNVALALCNRAKHAIFRLGKADLVKADRLLRLAYEVEPRGQYLAWRSLVRNTAHFEHRDCAFVADDLSSLQLTEEATRDAPDNSLVLAMAAQAHLVRSGDIAAAKRLALRSVECNATNPFGWIFLSNVQLANGERVASYATASSARAMMKSTPYRYFAELFACMSATGTGDYARAMEHAEAALTFCPHFVAPKRYLVALYKHAGRTDALDVVCRALRDAEPDFEISRLLDPNYPVHTLRNLPLIDAIA
ncbi:MAG: hypothetical protein AAF409_12955 [Pseudomonadota bacterium]